MSSTLAEEWIISRLDARRACVAFAVWIAAHGARSKKQKVGTEA